MPESPERYFEADVTRTLKFETLVTPRQQEAVRERLLSLAAAQTMLPPLAVDAERDTLRDHATTLRYHTLRLLNLLIMDATAFERARHLPRFYQYYNNVHGRHFFSMIRMSA